MKRATLILAALTLLLGAVRQARAGFVTVEFPRPESIEFDPGIGSIHVGGGNNFPFWTAGDYVTDTFTGTGVATVTSSHWVFDMMDGTARGVDNTFDVLINDTRVGSFDFVGAGNPGVRHFDLTFNSATPITGDTYTLKIIATDGHPVSQGGWGWNPGGQVTLTGPDASAVPEPSGLVLGGVAAASFAGYFGWRRRKPALA